MNKTQKAQYESYKKANKDRKAVLLERMGYKTQEEYFADMKITPSKRSAPVKVAKVKVHGPKVATSDSKPTDYVVAFDCTGSMSGYIKSVKEHVKGLVNDLFNKSPDLRMKIVAFGDYCDMNSNTDFGKAYQVIELTNNREAIIDFINKSQDTSGGDGDEFYELVIRKINTETDWRPEAAKAVLLIGDAPFHGVGYTFKGSKVDIKNIIDWKAEAQEAKSKGIQYDTLKIVPHCNWYEELSTITGGVSMDFKNTKKISEVIEGTVFARSSASSFTASYSKVMASGDDELIGAYKSMNTTFNVNSDLK